MNQNSIMIYPVTQEVANTIESLQYSYCQAYFLKAFPVAMRKKQPEIEAMKNRNRIWMELLRIERNAGKEDEDTLLERKLNLFYCYREDIQNSEIWQKAEEQSEMYALRKICRSCDTDQVDPQDLSRDEKAVFALYRRVMNLIPGTDPVREIRIIPTCTGFFDTDYIWDKENGTLYIARKKLKRKEDFIRTLVLGRITAGYGAVYTYAIPEQESRLLDEMTEYILGKIRN